MLDGDNMKESNAFSRDKVEYILDYIVDRRIKCYESGDGLSQEISANSGIDRKQVERILDSFSNANVITKINVSHGSNRSTRYYREVGWKIKTLPRRPSYPKIATKHNP